MPERVNVARMTTSLRLSADGRACLGLLAKELGVTKSAVLELAIREMATKYYGSKEALSKALHTKGK